MDSRGKIKGLGIRDERLGGICGSKAGDWSEKEFATRTFMKVRDQEISLRRREG
jgi:hypothetical protein